MRRRKTNVIPTLRLYPRRPILVPRVGSGSLCGCRYAVVDGGFVERGMKGEKLMEHTPTIEIKEKGGTYCALCGASSYEWYECEENNKDFIVKAVESYEKDQEIIRELIKALNLLLKNCETGSLTKDKVNKVLAKAESR